MFFPFTFAISMTLATLGLSHIAFAVEYAHDMPYEAPDYPGLATNYFEKKLFEVGDPQSGVRYASVHSTYGPTTANAETSGVCDGTTISAAQTQKYNLTCALLHALFNLQADWQSQQIELDEQEFQTCCQGYGCTVPKKYIHTSWSYTQRGKVTKGRVKVNAQGELDRNGQWCNWKFCTPCDASYCVAYTRAAYSSSSSNLADTHDPALRTGVPAGAPCSP